MKVFIVSGNLDYHKMWINNGHQVVDSFEKCDIVQFTGGADVSPVLYGEYEHPSTSASSERDAAERLQYAKALESGKLMVGICRGGQFLNVMNGGKMFQDVDNHGRLHEVTDIATGRTITCSSTHHQMMRRGPHSQLVAHAYGISQQRKWWPLEYRVPRVETGETTDAEVVYYHKTKCLCFQPHPEFFDVDHPCQKYYFELIDRHLVKP